MQLPVNGGPLALRHRLQCSYRHVCKALVGAALRGGVRGKVEHNAAAYNYGAMRSWVAAGNVARATRGGGGVQDAWGAPLGGERPFVFGVAALAIAAVQLPLKKYPPHPPRVARASWGVPRATSCL